VNIGVLGTGVVGRTLATRLVELGHAVALGSRDAASAPAVEWLAAIGRGRGARLGTFAEAAAHGALVINATAGTATLQALALAGAEHLHSKVLLDVANPLEFSGGAPSLAAGAGSLGERIQRAYPEVRVVKALNTVTAEVMTHPTRLGEDHTAFVAGDDAEAKATVADLLRSFGWKSILDLGGIEAARGMEMYLMLWLSVAAASGSPLFNVRIVRA
jgi:predicted dinucleotide-binding enzyme